MKARAIWSLAVAILCAGAWAGAQDYIVGPGDLLKIDIWAVPEMSGDAVVRPDGKITLPAVGDVEVAGKTPAEVSRILGETAVQYVKKPVVTVAVKQVSNNKIFLSGGGVSNQVVTLAGRTTLFRFLAGVGGIQEADLRKAYVVREGKEVFRDFHSLIHDGDLSKDFKLLPDDIVFIPSNEPNKIYVVGAVTKPRVILQRDGLTVLDAILSADGFGPFADKQSITLLRPGEPTRTWPVETLYGDASPEVNVALKAGDYVVVPSFETDRVYVSGEVATPRYLTYERKMRVLDAIYAAGGFTTRSDKSDVVVLGPGGKKVELDLQELVKGDNPEKNIPLAPGDHVVVRASFF